MEEVMHKLSGIHCPTGMIRIPYRRTSLCSKWQVFFFCSSQFPANHYYKKRNTKGFNDYILSLHTQLMEMQDISDKISENYYVPFQYKTWPVWQAVHIILLISSRFM